MTGTLGLATHAYGKQSIRFLAVSPEVDTLNGEVPSGDVSRVVEFTVDFWINDGLEESYLAGDNHRVVTSNSLRNIVHATAERILPASVEEVAVAVVSDLHQRYPFIDGAEADVWEEAWWPTSAGDRGLTPHRAFSPDRHERNHARVTLADGTIRVHSGIDGLMLFLTSGSSFEGFVVDDLTTDESLADRAICGALTAQWAMNPSESPSPVEPWTQRGEVRSALVSSFEEIASRSIQHLLTGMCRASLQAVPALGEIALVFESTPLVALTGADADAASMGPAGRKTNLDGTLLHAVAGGPCGVTRVAMARWIGEVDERDR